MMLPAVRYVRASDGNEIAYAVTGHGTDLVLLPTSFSSLSEPQNWVSVRNELLSQRLRITTFDGRGQGLSTRGLPPNLRMNDWLYDLEAVVERTGLETFALYGYAHSAHTAIRYAAANPTKVSAVILEGAGLSGRSSSLSHPRDVAEENWDLFISTLRPRPPATACRRAAPRSGRSRQSAGS
jgi:pimeloyl-ACP methyl ester carboxylesterase